MKVSKKVLALVMSAAVVTSIAAAGTLAYLTSQDTAVNTFTVGKVAITLDEAKVGPDGKKLEGEERVKENTYENILPGAELDKDPTVTVEGGSADCYVYVAVRNYLTDPLVKTEYAYYLFDEDSWDYSYFIPYDPGYPNHITRDISRVDIFRYKGSLANEQGIVEVGTEDVVLEPVFADGKMYVEGFPTAEELNNMYGDQVKVKAYAIQADNLVYDGPNGSGKTGVEAADQMAKDFLYDEANWK